MPLVLADRVKETTNTSGTGTLTLAGAVTGFQSFSAIGNGNTTYYVITSGSSDWEVGLGTYTASGTTLSRDTVYSSSSGGSAISVVPGAEVFVTHPATAFSSLVTLTGGQTLSNKTLVSPVMQKVGGDEGGEIQFEIPATNSTLAGTKVTFDLYQNKLRIFEEGGSNRGAFIDLSTLSNSVASEVVINDTSQTLTNKTISGASNTLSNIPLTAITSWPSGVDVTEVGYLDGVSSSIQTQINTKASTGKAIAMAIVFG